MAELQSQVNSRWVLLLPSFIDHIIKDIKILKDKSGDSKDHSLTQFVLTLDTTNLHQNFIVDNLESANNLEPMASQLSHQSNLVCDV